MCFEDVLWSWWGVMVGTGGAGPLPLGVIPGEALGMLAINYTLIFSVGIYCEILSSNEDEK